MVKSRKLTDTQRTIFAEKLMEWGNLVFVGLVITQIVPGTSSFRFSIAIAGIVIIAVSYFSAYYIMKGRIK